MKGSRRGAVDEGVKEFMDNLVRRHQEIFGPTEEKKNRRLGKTEIEKEMALT